MFYNISMMVYKKTTLGSNGLTKLFITLFKHSFLKNVSATFLLVSFVYLKESTFEIRKNIFLFHFKSSFRSSDFNF